MYKYKKTHIKTPIGLQDFYSLNENDIPPITKSMN